MNTIRLQRAVLMYGNSAVPVEPSQWLPLPETLTNADWDQPIALARKVAAIMSNASGGHTIKDVRVSIGRDRKTVNITGNGMHVYYSPDNLPRLTAEQAVAIHRALEVVSLGSVSTDQYGDGWKRARWDTMLVIT